MPSHAPERLLLLKIELPSKTAKKTGSESGRKLQGEGNAAIRCALCGAVVTHLEHRLQVNGRHDHAFFNPAGIAFEIRCFRQAPGVAPQGEPTAEFTWFPGHRWQIGLCRACTAHLGWLFHGSDQSFYGLITTRLA